MKNSTHIPNTGESARSDGVGESEELCYGKYKYLLDAYVTGT